MIIIEGHNIEFVANNDLTLIQGDDYHSSDGTHLQWTSSSWTTPSLSSATGKLRFITKEDYDAGVQTAVLEVNAAITWTESGDDAVFKANLTAAQTAALESPTPPGNKYTYVYQLQITLSNGRKITIAIGNVYVKQEIE